MVVQTYGMRKRIPVVKKRYVGRTDHGQSAMVEVKERRKEVVDGRDYECMPTYLPLNCIDP